MATLAVDARRAKVARQTGDQIARLVALIFATVVLLLVAVLVFQLWIGSADSRHKLGWGFLTSSAWNPVTEELGALPFMYGTVITSFV